MSEKKDALRRVEAFETASNDHLRPVEAVQASVLAKNTDLLSEQCATREQHAKRDVELQ